MGELYHSENIYLTLKREILCLEQAPGLLLPEQTLCDRFGVSRAPVRTALRRLADDGLVDTESQRGASVTLLDMVQIKQLIYTRTAVENRVLGDFIDIATPEMLARVREMIVRQTRLMDREGTTDAFYVADAGLHKIWFECTGMPMIWDIIQQFYVHYTRFRILDLALGRNFLPIIQEHDALLACLRAGDKLGAQTVMSDHLMGGINRMADRIQEEFYSYFKH